MRLLYHVITFLWPSGFHTGLLRTPGVPEGFSERTERQVGRALRPSTLLHPQQSFYASYILDFLIRLVACGMFTSCSKRSSELRSQDLPPFCTCGVLAVSAAEGHSR